MATATEADVLVVGAGVMGSSTARVLARAGRRVVVLERFRVGHKRGSSHGASRIFRLSYHDPLYVGMAIQALPLWRELEAETGQRLLTTTGGLDMGKALDAHVRALDEHGARFELLDGRDAVRRYPFVSLPPDGPVLFQPDAGIVEADRAVRAFVTSAEAHGADIREVEPALELRTGSDGVAVRTSSGVHRAPVIVVTAGAWGPALLRAAGVELEATPSQETVAYFRLDRAVQPPTLVDWGTPSVYALPSPGQGLKVGEHHAGPPVDPDQEGGPDFGSVERLSAWVASRFPSADPHPHQVETCLYTNTPDERFVMKREGSVVVGSPCSGHGFKFAPLIGLKLAAMALEGPQAD